MSLESLIPSQHLLAQSQLQKHQSKAPTTPKADKYKYIYIYIYIYIHTHPHIYIYVYTHTSTHIHTYILCMYICMCKYTHADIYIYICIYSHTHIHIHILYTHTHHIYTYKQTHIHIYTNTYIIINANNPSPTPNMQLLAGYLQLKLIFKSYQNAKSNSNIQRNDIMEKYFTHCTIDVMPLVILICNEKLLSSCPIKTNMNKRGFSQT